MAISVHYLRYSRRDSCRPGAGSFTDGTGVRGHCWSCFSHPELSVTVSPGSSGPSGNEPFCLGPGTPTLGSWANSPPHARQALCQAPLELAHRNLPELASPCLSVQPLSFQSLLTASELIVTVFLFFCFFPVKSTRLFLMLPTCREVPLPETPLLSSLFSVPCSLTSISLKPDPLTLVRWFPKWGVPGTAEAAAPGNSLEAQILGAFPDPRNQQL